MTISHDPSALVSELNDIFSSFDRILENFSGERIRTIGDSYMCACGLSEENEDHVNNMAKVTLRIRRYLERRNDAHPQEWRCRMGLNSGSVVGSLVGIQKYVYDLFWPGVIETSWLLLILRRQRQLENKQYPRRAVQQQIKYIDRPGELTHCQQFEFFQ